GRLEHVEAGVAQQHVGVLAAVRERQVPDGSVALVEVGAALEAVIEGLDERREGVGDGYVDTTGVRRYGSPHRTPFRSANREGVGLGVCGSGAVGATLEPTRGRLVFGVQTTGNRAESRAA